jgi:hypothetical protein
LLAVAVEEGIVVDMTCGTANLRPDIAFQLSAGEVWVAESSHEKP